jgi:hypothetical protein
MNACVESSRLSLIARLFATSASNPEAIMLANQYSALAPDRSRSRGLITGPQADPLEIFRARAWARALLVEAGELDLLDAVDVLQANAEAGGLVAAIGQDAVHAIMTLSFAAVRHQCSAAAGGRR